jgi:hypothetical protein
MNALRQRMRADLQIRNDAPQTLDCSLRCVAPFAQDRSISPARLGPAQVRQLRPCCLRTPRYLHVSPPALARIPSPRALLPSPPPVEARPCPAPRWTWLTWFGVMF